MALFDKVAGIVSVLIGIALTLIGLLLAVPGSAEFLKSPRNRRIAIGVFVLFGVVAGASSIRLLVLADRESATIEGKIDTLISLHTAVHSKKAVAPPPVATTPKPGPPSPFPARPQPIASNPTVAVKLPTPTPESKPKPTTAPTPSMRPSPASSKTPLPPPPIVVTPADQQKAILLNLLQQTPQARSGVWLSQIVEALNEGQYKNAPAPNALDFTLTAGGLAEDGYIEVLDATSRPYQQRGSPVQFLVDFLIRLESDKPGPMQASVAPKKDYDADFAPPQDGDYALTVTIRPSASVRPFATAILLTQPLDTGRANAITYSVLRSSSAMLGSSGVSSFGNGTNNVALIHVDYPPVTSARPLKITLLSKQPIGVVQVQYLQRGR